MSASNGTLNHDTSIPNMFWVNTTVWGLVVFLVIVMIISVGFYKTTKSEAYRVTESQYIPVNQKTLQAYEAESLHTLSRDSKSGKVQLTIDMAMDAVVRQYQ